MRAIRLTFFWLLLLTMAAHAAPPSRETLTEPAPQPRQLFWSLAYSDQADKSAAKKAEETSLREVEYDLYEEATDALDDNDWEDAAELFREVTMMNGRYADDAFYWMAYALAKDGRRQRARAALNELRERFPKSRWIEDAEVLELEIDTRHHAPRSTTGIGRSNQNRDRNSNRDRHSNRDHNSNSSRNSNTDPVLTPEADDDDSDIKMIILSSLMNSDPERAQPVLIKLLRKPNSRKVTEQALFLLAQMDSPAAREAIADFASNEKNPKLQRTAIEYLGIYGGEKNLHLLQQIYESTDDRKVKRQIIESYMIAGESDLLMEIARTESDDKLRRSAIEMVGVNGDTGRLWELYGNETSLEVRAQILEALMISGDTGHLLEVARSEDVPELRARAVEYMSINGDSDGLWQLYQDESDIKVRAQIIEGFMITGDSDYLVQIARQEKNDELRRKAIEMAGLQGATDELWDLYGTEKSIEIRKQILESMMINGEGDALLEVLRTESNNELRWKAIEYASISGGSEIGPVLGDIYDQESDRRARKKIIEALFINGETDILINIARKEKDPGLRRLAIEQLSLMDSPEVREFMLELLEDN